MRPIPEHLIVVMGGAPWAIPLDAARECHPLPMLQAAAEGSPHDVIGFVGVRGAMLPVVRPDARPPTRRLRLDDAIVLLETSRGRVALLVEAVTGIRRLRSGRSFALGEAPIAVLDAEETWREARPATPSAPAWTPRDEAEAVVLASRERTLAASPAPPPPGAKAMVLVQVAGRGYAVPLERVRAFVETSRAVPIPCAPANVRGDVNVRGEIVTLFDACEALGAPAGPSSSADRALVVGSRREVAGFVVDRIGDIVFLMPEQLRDLPIWDVDAMLEGDEGLLEEGSA